MLGGPISYEVDGEQYVAVSAGWGSILHLFGGVITGQKGGPQNGHVVAFKLVDMPAKTLPKPPLETVDALSIEKGRKAYNRFCIVCHGELAVSSGTTPDLRYSTTLGTEAFNTLVLDSNSQNGMPNFGGRLSRQEVDDVHKYVIHRAWLAYRDEQENTAVNSE